MSLRAAALLGLSLTLGACVALPPKPTAPNSIDIAGDWPARRAALLSLRDFALHGRVAVAAGDEGFNATLRWSQTGDSGTMQLEGPLGTGALRVEFDAVEFNNQQLRVTDARGVKLADAAAREELERRLGFTLPLRELSYWVRGVAAPALAGITVRPEDATADAVSETLDASGLRLGVLQQAGWRVDYANYAASPLGMMPQKLTARHEGYRIRLAIDRWGAP